MTTETALWSRWLGDRDKDMFATLVHPHLGFLFDYARRLGCSSSDADDVVQSALCDLLRQRNDNPTRIGMRAWLGRSVRSHMLMLRRAQRRRRRHEGKVPPPHPTAEHSLDAEDEVGRALAKLDPDARELVTLRFLHDLEYSEIARIVGRTPNACRIRVHRALERLRKDLGKGAPALIAAMPLRAPPAEAAEAMVRGALERAPVLPTPRWVGVGAAASVAAVVLVGAAIAVGSLVFATRSNEADERRERVSARRETVPATATPKPALPIEPPSTAGTADAVADAHAIYMCTGTILFTDGKPLVGADISVSVGGRVARTDAGGRYSLMVESAPYVFLRLDLGELEYLDLAHLDLGAVRHIEQDVTLARSAPVVGRVLDAATREPVVDAYVHLHSRSGGFQPARRAVVTTKADGSFSIPHVPHGAYTIIVRPVGHLQRKVEYDHPQTASVGEVLLNRAEPLRIRIIGAPPEARDTTFVCRLYGPGLLMNTVAIVKLDSDFTFTLDAPPPGEYRLETQGQGALPKLDETIRVTAGTPEPIEIRLAPGGSVEGVFRDLDGLPLAYEWLSISGRWRVLTDQQGRFRFPLIDVGRHSLTYSPPGPQTLRVASLEIREGGRIEIEPRLRDRCRLSGSVPALAAPARVRIELRRPGEREPLSFALVDPGSAFTMAHLPEGRFELLVTTPIAAHIRREVNITPGRPADLGQLALVPHPPVPIEVAVPADVPLPAGVRIGTGEHAVWVNLDAHGRGTVHSLPPGPQTAIVRAKGFEPTKITVTVAPGLAPVSVYLEPVE